MATITFTKETKGLSITTDGQKTSYNANIFFRGYNQGANEATINVFPFGTQPISIYSVNTATDTVTVNGVLFASTAEALIDSLRNTVFIADV